MKNNWRKIGLSALFSLALIACEDEPFEEENSAKKITVGFEKRTHEMAENAGEHTLLLKLDRPAFSDVVLTLKAGNPFEEIVNTIPEVENGFINILIRKGETSGVVKLTPIDNQDQTGNKTLELTLDNLPLQFIAGVHKALTITVTDDDTTGPVLFSNANFINQEITLEEIYAEGIEYQIHFSEAVAVHSTISISLSALNGTYGLHYASQPEAVENIVTLDVSAGSRVIGFKVRPVANDDITGELKVNLIITETTGSLRKGHNLQQTLTIKDDELSGKPRGYEVTAGNTIIKRFYEYNERGQISKVNWENYTPTHTQGSETYHYNDAGRLVRIAKYPGKDIIYQWRDENIVRSDEVLNGVLNRYQEFEYDAFGNVGLATTYYLNHDGNFAKGPYTLYLYFEDGNLYKSITYLDSQDPEDPYLVSTKTYDNYIDVINLFPMSEILPTVRTQTKLATTYRVEEGELDQTYHMTYEYRPDGLPEKRIATSAGDMQTAVYHYY